MVITLLPSSTEFAKQRQSKQQRHESGLLVHEKNGARISARVGSDVSNKVKGCLVGRLNFSVIRGSWGTRLLSPALSPFENWTTG